jgi:RNA polymerase sigma-70 factor (ECF subfamily)
MAGQAILGDTVLKQASASQAGTSADAIDAVNASEDAIEALVAEYSGMVFRMAYSILRHRDDAEDAVQECFLRIVKFRRRLAWVRNPKTWIARIAWTTALDRRAARAARAETNHAMDQEGLCQLPAQGVATDEALAGRELQDLLESLIAALPEDLRNPLKLSTVQELNSTEIAEILGIPENSVRTRLLRARRLLKEKLSARLEVKNHA